MTDKIIDGETADWGPRTKGQTKYQHLLDGNARELDIRDYEATSPTNFLTVVRKVARDRGLTFRSKIVDEYTVWFQVTGTTPHRRTP